MLIQQPGSHSCWWVPDIGFNREKQLGWTPFCRGRVFQQPKLVNVYWALVRSTIPAAEKRRVTKTQSVRTGHEQLIQRQVTFWSSVFVGEAVSPFCIAPVKKHHLCPESFDSSDERWARSRQTVRLGVRGSKPMLEGYQRAWLPRADLCVHGNQLSYVSLTLGHWWWGEDLQLKWKGKTAVQPRSPLPAPRSPAVSPWQWTRKWEATDRLPDGKDESQENLTEILSSVHCCILNLFT